ncbi:(-)-alpha-terpineol synthase-like [Cornus florida]|uniref:(-)-alpha-terpineol synthase-like n=1 Tax=Cornus florida TaxID=4283 RepID=UPI00289DEDAE|nr:(-)-alpha-terpineol synthase-like [Cornus florida]
MASGLIASFPLSTFTRPTHATLVSQRKSSSVTVSFAAAKACNQTVVRRSGNYQSNIWDYDRLELLTSAYETQQYTRRAEKLKENVRMMLEKQVLDHSDQLDLIDVLQRLGLSYHFQNEISKILENIYVTDNSSSKWKQDNLYATALQFRLLRQHGFHVPQDVFNSFVDDLGKFKACHSVDTKGMLCLYEASYLSVEGENMLEAAKDFTTTHLQGNVGQNIDDQILAMQVRRALEVPLHWRMPRLETRWFIDVYEQRQDMNPLLLELAKLDFNMLQATHLTELKHMARWSRSTGFGENLSFARDRLMENYLWTVGIHSESQFGYCRKMLTKINTFITTIDDVYDVYGTIDELELFTNAVDRWDINAMEQLPGYMKICFLTLYNSINEMAHYSLKEQGSYIIPYLKKTWAELCKCYLMEAKWYHSGHKPTLREYLDNAWVSISGPVVLVHAYFFVTKPLTKEALEFLERYPSIIRNSSLIFRLSNDLGTSSDEVQRGDVPKSIQCYMHETGASEEDARNYMKYLIDEAWKKMNEDGFSVSSFSETFIQTTMNLTRTAQCFYQNGDGYGVHQDRETKDHVLSLLIEPIPLL